MHLCYDKISKSLRQRQQYQRSVALDVEAISVQEQHKGSAIACQVQQVDCGTIDCTDGNHDCWLLQRFIRLLLAFLQACARYSLITFRFAAIPRGLLAGRDHSMKAQ